MRRDFSAGGIVYKMENNEPVFLLVKNAQLKNPLKAYWGFPKGHLEGEETPEEAAVREVKEETGILVELIQKVDDSKYIFTDSNKEKVSKVVAQYLMRYVDGETERQESEIAELGWFKADDAFNILNFKNDKVLLTKALRILQNE